MTRDELARRSEGALDTIDDAVIRMGIVARLLREPDWFFRVRAAPALLREEVDREALLAEAMARVRKLEASALKPLNAARARVGKLASKRLRELDLEPTATKLEDLLAQLVARCVDTTREEERIARGWERSAQVEARNTTIGALTVASGILGGLALSLATPVWVAAAPALLAVAGGLAWSARSRPCPACGRAIRSQNCPHCGQTPPSD